MVQLLSAFVSLLSVVAVSGAAIPAPAPEAVADVAPETATIEPTGNFTAQACMYTCGSVCYSSSAISAALNKGYSYYEDGATAGSSMFLFCFRFPPFLSCFSLLYPCPISSCSSPYSLFLLRFLLFLFKAALTGPNRQLPPPIQQLRGLQLPHRQALVRVPDPVVRPRLHWRLSRC